jgi:hypothetical protein
LEKDFRKAFPEVYAFGVYDDDYFFLLERVQENLGVKDTRVKEYGVNFDNKFIEAFFFKVRAYFVIVIRKSVPLEVSLEHELKHFSSKT